MATSRIGSLGRQASVGRAAAAAERWACALVVLLFAAGMAAARPLDLPPELTSQDAEARGFADLLFSYGMVELTDGDYESARSQFERAATIQPDDRTYIYFVGVCRMRQGSYESAIAALERALPPGSSRIPEARIRSDLGEAYFRIRDFAAAEDQLLKSVALDDSDGTTRYYLGLVYFARDDTKRAMREFDRAVELDPALANETAYYLGVEAQKRGDLAESRDYFEQVLASGTHRQTQSSTRRWLDAMSGQDQATRVPRGEFNLSLLGESDNNPGQLDDSDQLSSLVGNDLDQRSVLQLRAAYNPLTTRDWTVGLVFNGYGSRHSDFESADLLNFQGVVQAAWGADPLGYVSGPLGYARLPRRHRRLSLLLQGGVSHFELNDDSFRRDQEAAAALSINQKLGKSQIELRYSDLKFFNPLYTGYSGHNTMLRVGQYLFLGGRPDRYLRVAGSRTEHTARSTGLDSTNQWLAELTLPLSKRWSMRVSGSSTRDEYDEQSQVAFAIPSGSNRRDERTDLGASAFVGISNAFFASLSYGWTSREVFPSGAVSASVRSFRRQVVSGGLTYHW